MQLKLLNLITYLARAYRTVNGCSRHWSSILACTFIHFSQSNFKLPESSDLTELSPMPNADPDPHNERIIVIAQDAPSTWRKHQHQYAIDVKLIELYFQFCNSRLSCGPWATEGCGYKPCTRQSWDSEQKLWNEFSEEESVLVLPPISVLAVNFSRLVRSLATGVTIIFAHLGVGWSHGHSTAFTYGLSLHCAPPDGGITSWRRRCSSRPPAPGPAPPRTPEPAQPAAGPAASPSGLSARPPS